MSLLSLLFGGPSQQEIQDAVDLQMQPLWKYVNGTFFDSNSDLDRKQKKIRELQQFVSQTADPKIMKAQLYWLSVAQYTIDHERYDRAKKLRAEQLIPTLPPLPGSAI